MVSCYTTERFRKSLILTNQVLTDALKSNMYESDAMSPCGFLQQKACILKAENHRFAPSHQQSLWKTVSRKSCTSEVVDTYTSWTTSSSYHIISESYTRIISSSYHHHFALSQPFPLGIAKLLQTILCGFGHWWTKMEKVTGRGGRWSSELNDRTNPWGSRCIYLHYPRNSRILAFKKNRM